MPKRLEEIVDIPNAYKINNQKEVDKLLNQTKAFTRDEFSRILLKCHNIIRNNDKLSPEAAFDEISKILFIKILYERSNEEGQIFSKERFKESRKNYEKLNKEMGTKDAIPFYQNLFARTKKYFANDHLFRDNEIINIRENSFEEIVKQLEIYNLSTTSDDVKGIAFEKFLGRTFRGELGQYFTPRPIVNFMVKVLDPREGELVCDPCCGSGGFLIRAFEYVRDIIERDIEKQKEDIKQSLYQDNFDCLSKDEKEKIDRKVSIAFNRLNEELDTDNTNGRLHSLSYDCIYGTDANPRMARTAKMNMIMHGDGHGGVHHHDGLLNVNGIFKERFDVILTNPPFGSRVERSQKITEADKFTDKEMIAKYTARFGEKYIEALNEVNNNVGKSLLSLFTTGSMSALTEVLFIERCLNLLKPGGRMGIVLPEGTLNNDNLQRVREYVEGRAKILLIVSIPQDVFMASKATVKPSLMFFKRFTEDEEKKYQSIKLKAKKEVLIEYNEELTDIGSKLALKGKESLSKEEKRKLNIRKETILQEVEMKVKVLVKDRFDYIIPVAEVEKAGISTTGSEIEDDLVPLEEEFTPYRKKNTLWKDFDSFFTYHLDEDTIFRTHIVDGNTLKSEIFYKQK